MNDHRTILIKRGRDKKGSHLFIPLFVPILGKGAGINRCDPFFCEMVSISNIQKIMNENENSERE